MGEMPSKCEHGALSLCVMPLFSRDLEGEIVSFNIRVKYLYLLNSRAEKRFSGVKLNCLLEIDF